MDWLAKAIGLPTIFYHSNKDTLGGGVIQVVRATTVFSDYSLPPTKGRVYDSLSIAFV